MAASDHPVLVFDGDCAFCRRWVERWRKLAGGAVEFVPYQQAAHRFPQVSADESSRAIHLIEPDGTVERGAAAVFRMLAVAGHKRWLNWCYERLPGFRPASEVVYRFVSGHRGGMDRVDRALLGTSTEPVTYYRTRAIFLRLLGVIYLIAFLSLRSQIDGLIGSRGVAPAHEFLDNVRRVMPGHEKYRVLPTLFWLSSSDTFLHGMCLSGVVASALLIIGLLPGPALLWLWIDYVSLMHVGQDFLGYQWDALLVEAGFIALLFAPFRFVIRTDPARSPPPSFAALMLLRWLLFRVMFMSGVVKLSSHDPAWRDLTAMGYHYWTQPLPAWTSWYMAQLPMWVHKIETLFTLLAELWLPLFIFTPRRARWLAFWGTVSLQLLITATGNYGFFNLLTIVLSVTLIDDAGWSRLWKRGAIDTSAVGVQPEWDQKTVGLKPDSRIRSRSRANWRALSIGLIALALFLASLAPFIRSFNVEAPAPLAALQQLVSPYHLANGYGLFAVMTTTRPEIQVEGSDDGGATWRAYTFRYKAGADLTRRPKFCTPHMPRLDWQMWFEALYVEGGSPRISPWFVGLLHRLLENEPAVIRLLARNGNPFPDHPPQLVRAVLYEYQFTTRDERSATGWWWKRREVGTYVAPVSLKDFRQVDRASSPD